MSTAPPAASSLLEQFAEWSSAYRSAVPWPWPRSLTDDELQFFGRLPGLKPERGAIINNRFVIWGTYKDATGEFYFDHVL